jgi:hypothetical protein
MAIFTRVRVLGVKDVKSPDSLHSGALRKFCHSLLISHGLGPSPRSLSLSSQSAISPSINMGIQQPHIRIISSCSLQVRYRTRPIA